MSEQSNSPFPPPGLIEGLPPVPEVRTFEGEGWILVSDYLRMMWYLSASRQRVRERLDREIDQNMVRLASAIERMQVSMEAHLAGDRGEPS